MQKDVASNPAWLKVIFKGEICFKTNIYAGLVSSLWFLSMSWKSDGLRQRHCRCTAKARAVGMKATKGHLTTCQV